MNREILTLYAITPEKFTDDDITAALEGKITCLQLRMKGADTDAIVEKAVHLKKLCDKYNVPLIINDNVEAALLSGANGVHLGKDDGDIKSAREILGKDKIIGATAKTVEDAVNAENASADYLGSGAIFASLGKPDAKHITLDEFKAITKSVNIPVCAIGGIDENNIDFLQGSGASGIAVISAVFNDNVKKSAEILRKKSEEIFYGR